MTSTNTQTTADTLYKPEYATQASDLLNKGASIAEIAMEIGIDRLTLYRWINPKSEYYHQDFAQAIELIIL